MLFHKVIVFRLGCDFLFKSILGQCICSEILFYYSPSEGGFYLIILFTLLFWLYVPYARHYNPRFVYFLPHFSLRFIL
jgi:hypothetical protein